MDALIHLGNGFLQVLQPTNLLVLFVGLVLGMLVAVLPGLTLVMGVVLALPFTYTMELLPAIILLTAMYVSGTYGGAFTAILFRIPGEPIDVPLLWDGYTMARNGQPAKALGWTLFSALGGGLVMVMEVTYFLSPSPEEESALSVMGTGRFTFPAALLFSSIELIFMDSKPAGAGIPAAKTTVVASGDISASAEMRAWMSSMVRMAGVSKMAVLMRSCCSRIWP